ncbi:hypothetical protein [Bradyrhizobium sp.]|uniref:AtuA-related protein n=1 Tax=Bradyrhizobium sp. TaxID=376 RepID=UPI0039E615F0
MAQATLYDYAHARTGDKGERSSISLFAYKADDYELLVREVTEERVTKHFSFRHPSMVKRYLLPKLGGMNFVIDDVLDGGVNQSLNLDMHGKALSFHLLAMQIETSI